MRVRINRTRMAMGRDSRVYAYAGYVLASDVPHIKPHEATTSLFDGDYRTGPDGQYLAGYFDFHEATLPADHRQRPQGWDRYDAYKAHKRAAEAELLALAKTVYPELANVTEWPFLWVELPAVDEQHATRYAERQATT